MDNLFVNNEMSLKASGGGWTMFIFHALHSTSQFENLINLNRFEIQIQVEAEAEGGIIQHPSGWLRIMLRG